MMQNLGNRRSVQKCAQKAGSYVLKQVLTGTRKLFSINKSERFQDVTKLSVQQTMVHVLCLRHRYVCLEFVFLSWIIYYNKSLVFTRVCEGYSTNN